MHAAFSQLTGAFAAGISGIDIGAAVDDKHICQIVNPFNENTVLVFRGQDMTDGQ